MSGRSRAAESLRVLRRKAEVYVAYFLSGVEQRRSGAFPKVVFVVPDQRRRAAVSDLLGQLDADYWQLFQVVTPPSAVLALCGRPPPSKTEVA